MARKRSRRIKEKDVQILGGLDAVTKLLALTQKTGKRRLRNEQIRTGLTLSVGGVRKQVVLERRKSDRCRFLGDRDSRDRLGPYHCDSD
jgi:hypothetical protein